MYIASKIKIPKSVYHNEMCMYIVCKGPLLFFVIQTTLALTSFTRNDCISFYLQSTVVFWHVVDMHAYVCVIINKMI